MAPLAPWWPVV